MLGKIREVRDEKGPPTEGLRHQGEDRPLEQAAHVLAVAAG
jgi:hypothetical protein